MEASFVEKLTASIDRNGSILCVGLDPDPGRLPLDRLPAAPPEEQLVHWSTAIIEQTADLVCCYKPNFAFFEQYGPPGLSALQRVIASVPDRIPVLLDAKRGDIGHTATAYARAAFEVWQADAVTISPYLGQDSVAPFLAYEGKAVFVLCQTSNPSAAAVQNRGPTPLYREIARLGQTWGNAQQLGFVVGATRPESLAAVRALAPDRWLLAPGIGAQGGDLAATLAAGLSGDRGRLIVPASRSIIYADDPRQAALDLRQRINRYRRTRPERDASTGAGEPAGPIDLIMALHEAGCVQFGDFTLASGQQSPVYIDLRRIVSYPGLFRQVVDAYAKEAARIGFDCLAAVPYAALPTAAALALALDRPLIYSRKEAKDHGTGRAVEGVFEPGQTALVIEDVVTSGGSLLRAIETLEAAGLQVTDTVVFVNREQGGGQRLMEAGYALHTVLTMRTILDVLRAQGRVSGQIYDRVQTYLARE
jgi:uridine monophosphate synthetase